MIFDLLHYKASKSSFKSTMVETQATKVLHLCSENSIFKTLNTLMQLNAEKFAKCRNVRNYVYFDVHIS